jgi:hypothetical protein
MPHFHYHTCLSWLFASNYHIEINIINIKINYTNKKRKKEEYTPLEQLQNIIDVETAIK